MPRQFEFGQEVIDPVTGMIGMVVGRLNHINGCRKVEVQPKLLKGKVQDSWWVDESRLVFHGKPIKKKAEPVKTGGPGDVPTRFL